MSSNKTVLIGTHDGSFHCDEALAIFLLKLLPRYKDAVIIRTRNFDTLNTCDIVVDVGRKYEPSTHRYDHHMRDFNESLSTVINKARYDSTIKLSSAGLIYCHFGEEIIKQLLPEDTSDATIEIIFKKVYYKLIREIDAIDNGIPMYDSEPLYNISSGITARVSRLNPTWNDKTTDVSEQFQKAMDLAGEEFLWCVNYTMNVWWPARCIVEKALLNRFKVDESGEIIELEIPVPWQGHLVELEQQYNIEPIIKYVIFADDIDSSSRVRAVPVKPQSFVCRMLLPESWGGLRYIDLDKVSGISGCIFVHAVRFIGGHINKAGVREMARRALEIGKSSTVCSEDAQSASVPQ